MRILLLFTSALMLMVSLSPSIQRKVAKRNWIPDQYRFGDLYNISNLKKFKEVDFVANSTLIEQDKPSKRSSLVDFYVIGDSFTPMDTSYYAGKSNHHIWLGLNVDTVELVPSRKSILVIEIIERTIQERLKEDFKKLYIDKGFQLKGGARKEEVAQKEVSFWWKKFADQIDQRIEFLFFNFKPFLALKEVKAGIMLSWFNRTHTGATLSSTEEYIFYDIEANPNTTFSPFHLITDTSIDTIVTNMNSIRSHYLDIGFEEVYFCLIPNKTTVCESDRSDYNHQISRIEHHPGLVVPVISIQDTLRNHPEWYHLGDGHWNLNGQRFWLRTVNDLIYKMGRELGENDKRIANSSFRVYSSPKLSSIDCNAPRK